MAAISKGLARVRNDIATIKNHVAKAKNNDPICVKLTGKGDFFGIYRVCSVVLIIRIQKHP